MTVSEYDAAGNLLAETDAQGQTTAYTYDALGRLTAVTGPDPDGAGPLQAPVTTYAYDQAGRKTAETDFTGRVTSYFYDARDRLVAVTLPDPDGAGPLPRPVLHYSYDAASQRLTETDASGRTTGYAYDGLGRVTAVTGPDPDGTGPLAAPVTHYAYDAADRLTAVTDPLEHVTSYSYDALDHRTTVTDASGTTAFAYDDAGNLLCLTDPDGNTTRWTYDSLDRVSSETDQPGVSRQFGYDALGRLVSLTDRNGLRREYAYDVAGRLTTETWYAANGVTVVDTLTYTYDAAGRVTSAGNGAGTYTYSYDAQGRLASVSGPFGVSLSYGYDSAGNRILVQDSFGGAAVSSYDAQSRLVSRSFSQGGQPVLGLTQRYDAAGQLAEQTRTNAAGNVVVSTAYGYDAAGRLTALTHARADSSVVAGYAFGYDAAGALVSQTDHGVTHSYGYDASGQLTQADGQAYSYDAAGNRTNEGYVTGTDNQLLSDGVWDYTYDAEGNVTGKANAATGETWTYAYDHRNRLVRAEHRDALGQLLVRAEYAYDVYDHRIAQTVTTLGGPTVVTRFAYDGDLEWAVLDGSNQLVKRYVSLDAQDSAFARVSADGSVAWLLADRLGSIRDIVDATGTVIDRIDYDAWGNVVSETNPAAGDELKYAGYWYDAALGLYQVWHRWYDAGTGRWLQKDPLGFEAGDANLQRYVENGPTGGTDPRGLFDEKLFWVNVEKLSPGLKSWFEGTQCGVVVKRPAYWFPGFGLFNFKATTTYMPGGDSALVYLHSGFNELEAAQRFIKEVTEDGWLAGEWKRRNIDSDPVGTHADWAAWVTKQMAQAGATGAHLVMSAYTIELKGVNWVITASDIAEGNLDWSQLMFAAAMLPRAAGSKFTIEVKGGKKISMPAPTGVGAGGMGRRARVWKKVSDETLAKELQAIRETAGRFDCGHATLAVDEYLKTRSSVRFSQNLGELSQVDVAAKFSRAQRDWRTFASDMQGLRALERRIRDAGDGATGIVWLGRAKGTGHYVNIWNDGGRTRWLCGQSGSEIWNPLTAFGKGKGEFNALELLETFR